MGNKLLTVFVYRIQASNFLMIIMEHSGANITSL